MTSQIPNIQSPIKEIPTISDKSKKHNIEDNQLNWLPVSYSSIGPARNDDTYAPLNCTWYDKLVRIATIGDGSCFIHAVLKGFSAEYQNNNNAKYRLDTAAKLRRDLAMFLRTENKQYPGHTLWGTTARGAFPRLVMQQVNNEDLVGEFGIDYSIVGLQRLFNSTNQLGDEVYTYVADAIGIDIYVLRATKQDLYPHYHTRHPGIIRNSVVIIGNKYHYETVAVETNEGFQTFFQPNDPFMIMLTKVFIGDGGFNDIVNVMPYDPDQTFVNDAVEAFTGDDGFQIPPVVYEIFNETDPFLKCLIRLTPRIEAAARRKRNSSNINPVLQKLDNILQNLEHINSGQRINIRNIVENRILQKPDVPQDLNTILSSAETDGLLSHEIVDSILNNIQS